MKERRLELHFQRELDLPGRAEVSSREARAGDGTERPAAHDKARITEVRVVKNVEHFRPELQVKPLRQLRILDDGKVGIDKARPSDGVTAQDAGMANRPRARRNENGLVRKPLSRVPRYLNRSSYIRPSRKSDARID